MNTDDTFELLITSSEDHHGTLEWKIQVGLTRRFRFAYPMFIDDLVQLVQGNINAQCYSFPKPLMGL